MSLEKLEKEIKSCRKCSDILRKYNIKPKPIFSGKAIIELKEKEENGFMKDYFGENLSKLKVKNIVGKSFYYNSSKIIPLIHPSGAANGVRSLNKNEHLESIKILKESLKNINK